MLRSIIKYGGLALVIIGIILVMKNLLKKDPELTNTKEKIKNTTIKTKYYSASVSLLDKDTKEYITGAKLVVKDKSGNVISGWISENGLHLVSNLKNGTYTLVEESANENYNLNTDGVTFTINNKNQDVTMYNTKMTPAEKEKKEQEERAKNTTSNEIGVDNTLSEKGVVTLIMSIMCIFGGVLMIFTKKEES